MLIDTLARHKETLLREHREQEESRRLAVDYAVKVSWAKRRTGWQLVPQIDPSVPQPVVQSRRRPLLGPSIG